MYVKKRGISPVIAAVLLLVITVIAASIIIGVVVPFVQDTLDTSKECFEIIGDVSFAETPYNCFNSSATGDSTGFSVRVDNEKIIGFRVSLQAVGSSIEEDILNGENLSNIRMLDMDFDLPLEVPGRGGIRTYVARGKYDKIEIFPILESRAKCDDLADSVNINKCDDFGAIGNITQY